MAFGGSCNSETTQPISIKLDISDHIAHPTPQTKFGYTRFKGGVAAHARISPLGVYFFPCAWLQTSPLDRPTPLIAQTKRPDAGHIPYKFSIKILKIYFFMPQFLTICITAYGDFKAV